MWNLVTWPDRALAQFSIKLIQFYQATFSPDHSDGGKGNPINGCKFYPSCSHYGINAFKKYGFLGGLPRVVWRVLRCHPWSHGGVEEA